MTVAKLIAIKFPIRFLNESNNMVRLFRLIFILLNILLLARFNLYPLRLPQLMHALMRPAESAIRDNSISSSVLI